MSMEDKATSAGMTFYDPSDIAPFTPAPKAQGRAKAATEPHSVIDDAAERYVDRLVALMEAKNEVAADIKELKNEAKGAGFDPAALMIVVKRKMETPEERASRETVEFEAEQIMARLGMLASTPLGEAAMEAERHRGRG